MAKIDLKFLDLVYSYNFIKVNVENVEYWTAKEDKTIQCEGIQITLFVDGEYSLIDLDKSTAIKFAKTLRTEINKIQE